MVSRNRFGRLSLLRLESRLAPAVYTVVNLGDTGTGSLRWAVDQANGGSGADTVNFKGGMAGEINLAGEITVKHPVTIDGPGNQVVTVSGKNASRIFNVEAASGNVTITDLTLAFGRADYGGAVSASVQNVTLVDCIFFDNHATTSGGAVALESGNLVATDCQFLNNSAASNGGAVAVLGSGLPTANGGSAKLTGCTVSGNSATEGGGVFARDNLVIEDSTVTGNTAQFGGGLRVAGFTIMFPAKSTPGSLLAVNSTLSGNQAVIGGGVFIGIPAVGFNVPSSLILRNCTITNCKGTGAAGGVRGINMGPVTVQSSVVAQNSGTEPDLSFDLPVSVNGENNLVGVGNAGNFTLTANNQTGTSAVPLDAKLSGLGSFGGPTQTHHPLAGSPAVDKGANPAGLLTDQRGKARVHNGVADVGAVEVTPATFVVDRVADELDGNYSSNDVSLREALALANASAATADVITFSPTVFATAKSSTLTLGELAVTGSVNISGPTAQLSLSGNSAGRVFNTSPAPAGAAISIANLRMTAGKTAAAGGAVLGGDEAFSLFNCVLEGNSAATGGGAVALTGAGSLAATTCTFKGNTDKVAGGAIRVTGAAATTLTGCVITGNSAPAGGGVDARGYLTLEASTLSGNSATLGMGGGVRFDPAGAAGTFFARNCTVSGNSATTDGGGIALFNVNVTAIVRNSTLTANGAGGNGGGIAHSFGAGTLVLNSTIVAQNTAGGGAADVHASTGSPTSGEKNLVGVADVGNLALNPAVNQLGTAASPLDAMLGVLKVNWGNNALPTHFPLPGSPVIDMGGNPIPVVSKDQRGYPRSSGAGPDVGAVEVQAAQNYVVDITADENDFLFAKGDLSLREALWQANVYAESADSVGFDPAVFGVAKTITLSLGEIPVNGPVTVAGPGLTLLNLSGGGVNRIFNLTPAAAGTPVTLSGLRLTGGKSAGHGGAITASDQHLTLSKCELGGNSAGLSGGAVSVFFLGSLTADDCQFTANTASAFGGAVSVFGLGSKLTLRRCELSGNAAKSGGSVYTSSTLLVEDSTVSGNSATAGRGGGLLLSNYYNPGGFTVRNSTVSGNSATSDGGGIGLIDFTATLAVQNSTVTANAASGKGGGIARSTGTGSLTLESSIVAKNTNAIAPEVFTAGTVQAKTTALFNQIGITTFVDQGGNLAPGTDPLLEVLSNNGGPTRTHALKAGSPCLNAGSNPAALTTDQRGAGFPRTASGVADMGAFEVQPAAAPPTALVQVNDGAAQRSVVTSFKVTFSEAVTFPSGLAAAFTLQRTGPGSPTGAVTLAFQQTGNVVTVTYNDATYAPGLGKSLIDGNYAFTLVAANIQGAGGSLDGDANGVGGDNGTLLTHRLFGDADGDRDVDAVDYGLFRPAFGGATNLAFDSDGDGDVDAVDFGQFRLRFGSAV